MTISQYSIRPWEKWAHAFGFKELWYVEPDTGEMWLGAFSDHMIEKAGASWFNQNGQEESVSGYIKRSRRWRTLTLRGPFRLDQIVITLPNRQAWASPVFSLPGGRYVKFSIKP
jgi:competence protein CoiA